METLSLSRLEEQKAQQQNKDPQFKTVHQNTNVG